MLLVKNLGRRRPRPGLLLGAVGAMALLTAALPSVGIAGEITADAARAPAVITIDNHDFTPETLTVTAGARVTWKNADDTVHTVAADNKSFRSGALDTGDSFSYTFAAPGEYQYFCTLHPYMVGKIIVKPAGKSL